MKVLTLLSLQEPTDPHALAWLAGTSGHCLPSAKTPGRPDETLHLQRLPHPARTGTHTFSQSVNTHSSAHIHGFHTHSHVQSHIRKRVEHTHTHSHTESSNHPRTPHIYILCHSYIHVFNTSTQAFTHSFTCIILTHTYIHIFKKTFACPRICTHTHTNKTLSPMHIHYAYAHTHSSRLNQKDSLNVSHPR